MDFETRAGPGRDPPRSDGTPISLLEKLHRNDPGAWERAIHLYEPLVRFWCRRAGVFGADAEDLIQEVFTAAATGIAGFHRDQPGDTFRGWLRGITRIQVLRFRRANHDRPLAEGGPEAMKRFGEVHDPIGPPDLEEQLETHAVSLRAMEQVRCQFEEKTWTAFWKTAVEGFTPAEAAAALASTPAAIRQAKSRVLRRLREELGELLGPDAAAAPVARPSDGP